MVSDQPGDILLVHRPCPLQQEQLVDLLRAGQQVAFHPLGQHAHGPGRRFQPAPAHACLHPAGGLLHVQRPHEAHHPGSIERLHPFAPACLRLQFAGGNQQQGIFR